MCPEAVPRQQFHLVGPPGVGGGHDDSFALKGDGTSDRTIVIRDRGGTHGSKDPNRAGPTSLHGVAHHDSKERPRSSNSSATPRPSRWRSTPGTRSHRGNCPWRGLHARGHNRQPRSYLVFFCEVPGKWNTIPGNVPRPSRAHLDRRPWLSTHRPVSTSKRQNSGA